MYSKFIKIFSIVYLVIGAVVLADDNAYRIEVKVDKFKGDVCYLGYPYGDKKYLADTAELNDEGLFVFEGTKPLDGGLYFIYSPKNLYFDLIVAEPEFNLMTDTLDLIQHMKTEGSLENEVFFDYQRFMREKQKIAGELSEQLKKASEQQEKDKISDQLKSIDTEVKNFQIQCFRKVS